MRTSSVLPEAADRRPVFPAKGPPTDFAPYMGAAARRLLGEPNKHLSTKAELRFGTHGSVSVDLKKGTWFDHEANQGGGVLDLIRRERGLDVATAIWWLEHEQGGDALPDPKAQAARANRKATAEAQEAAEAAAKRGHAEEFWRQSECVGGSGPGFTYLTRARGLTRWYCDRVRYHPRCGFGWIEIPPFGFRHTAAAIIAPVTCHKTGYVVGIWRIRLTPAGELVKRLGLGDAKGNAARLFPAEGDELAIAEGVEDALAFHELTGLPSWAALSAGNMRDLIVPSRFRRVVIVQDNDEPNRFGERPGPEAAQALARRLAAEGRAVEIIRPRIGKDANDALRGGAPA